MAETIIDVVGGVDTHGDVHVAALVDTVGRILDTASFPTTPAGYRRLLSWMRRHGVVARVGVEGTGAWGAGLARYLTSEGVEVIEVDRPNRRLRRQRGKSDTVDAEAAARAALNGEAKGKPKAKTGPVEAIRALRVVRRSAMKGRTQAFAQLRSLITTAPDELRTQLRGLSTTELVATAVRFRPADPTTLTGATKLALREVAARIQFLEAQTRPARCRPRPARHPDLPRADRPPRRRTGQRRGPPRRRRRQPRTAPQRVVLRPPVRLRPH